ncbi:hypothetical protein JGH11_04615 [Dysgonomonas sp. Marseille-P4677]|uniref:hypothetical protein n=1 Tax=Dysgonomonas sp. Marseille-P4677 TaxID=2364790 RepID=UPI0019147C23|nr:hypothetical protein [Dysgonomonas sp. Marseille-P4677]MBK5720150.1 hypothetical protein [Dysgonomonas sp. Marseille-P4677]
MKTEKTKETTELTLARQGELSLRKAQKTVNFTLKEMAAGQKLDAQMHIGDGETLFVFIANGICATLHLQAFDPVMEGGIG